MTDKWTTERTKLLLLLLQANRSDGRAYETTEATRSGYERGMEHRRRLRNDARIVAAESTGLKASWDRETR